MGRFVRHEPCPSCGSRDNLGRWDDGSAYCFGCHYKERSQDVKQRLRPDDAGTARTDDTFPGYEAGTTALSESAKNWLWSYGITGEEALRAGLRWNSEKSQLIFPFYDETRTLRCTQARNFDPYWSTKAKYFNSGAKEEAFQIYQSSGRPATCNSLVITEDAVSAIKVARLVDAMPALGTSVPVGKLVKIQRKGYQKLIVWLDRDKWKEGMEIAEKAKWLGLSTDTILTDLDPKCYNDEEIRGYLCN